MQGDEDNSYKSQKWIEDMSNGLSHELEALTLGGIQIEEVQKGLIRCKFLIPKYLSDKDGNWHAGAIAVLIDDVAAAVICSMVGHIKVSVSFNISYFSTAKIQEEVEIEGEVVGHKGMLTLVSNGCLQLAALASFDAVILIPFNFISLICNIFTLLNVYDFACWCK